MISSPDFKAISNRDAWSTIRGFVYQVDYTILRWIKLNENEALELEKGEDIDHLREEIGQNDIRTLEQLKHRENKISLNQFLTLESLRNFYIHRVNNPGLVLKFRFVTNNDYGRELPSIFLNGRKGVDVWTELNQKVQIDVNDNDYQVIKRHLLKKIKEHISTDPNAGEADKKESLLWEGFEKYIEQDDHLISVIQDVEWSVQNANAVSISTDIIAEITQRYPEKSGQILYERLFLYVFKLLCTSDTKRLDLKTLEDQSALPELGEDDKKLLDFLNQVLGNVQNRLNKLENKTTFNESQINSLFKKVDGLQSNTVFDLRLNNQSFDPPDLVNKGSVRTEKVNEIERFFENTNWIAFQGINGTGKTQLAALVCRKFANCYWLDLREMATDAFKAPLVIEAFLTGLTGVELKGDRNRWMVEVIGRVQKGTMLVFNDIPEVTNNDPGLKNLLCALGHAIPGKEVYVLTTSNHHFPNAVRTAPAPEIIEYRDFDFTDDEINECLINNGADENFLEHTTLIAARSQRTRIWSWQSFII